MTGIVEILFDTLRTFAGCCARQERTHQFFVTLHAVEMCRKSVDKSTLIILWSTVQVRDALPFQSFKSLCKSMQSDFFHGRATSGVLQTACEQRQVFAMWVMG